MTDLDKKVFSIKEDYQKRYYEIVNSPDLTAAGKGKAVEALNTETLNNYSSIRQALKEQLKGHSESLEKLKKPAGQELTAEEIEGLKYQGNLILSQLSAAKGPAEFEAAASEAAAANPAAFQLAYQDIKKLAQAIAPAKVAEPLDPWSRKPQAEQADNKAARLHVELDGMFQTAKQANISPADAKRKDQAEITRELINNTQGTITLIDRFEKEIKHPSPWPAEVAEG